MKHQDYPSLYQAADKASLSAQKAYTFLVGLDLGFMISGALLSIYSFQFDNQKAWIYILAFIMLTLGLVVTLFMKFKKYEDTWYQGRALAESVKTLTWGFITGSEVFGITLSTDNANKLFIDRIKELATKFDNYTHHFENKIILLPTITENMKEQRNKSFSERKNYYAKYRIKNQKDWYATKANHNKKRYNLWFVIIVLSQAIAVCSSFYLIKFPASNWNVVGLFTTIASVGIAWLQLKQHQQLKQAYITAAIELKFIEEKGVSVQSEQELAKYVFDSENAISREHTLWLAQKRA